MENNLFNSIFHRSEVKNLRERFATLSTLISNADDILDEIGDVKFERDNPDNPPTITGAKTLLQLLSLHKKAWKLGIRNKNIGPDMYGMFRTEDIMSMSPNEVLLGDIYGLWTNDINFWEAQKNVEKTDGGGYAIYQYLSVYEIILRQYKHHLSSNIKAIQNNAVDERRNLKELGYG